MRNISSNLCRQCSRFLIYLLLLRGSWSMFNLKDWSSVIRRYINSIIYPITSHIAYSTCTNSTESIFRQKMNYRCGSRYCNKIPPCGTSFGCVSSYIVCYSPPETSFNSWSWSSIIFILLFLVSIPKNSANKNIWQIYWKKIQSTLNKIQIPTIFVNVVEKKHIW